MGHEVVAPDLPCDDDSAGLAEYADAVVEAIGDRTDGLVLVAQSLAGFTAPLVCERLPVELLVLVAAMVPAPGEPPGEWWTNTGLGTGAPRAGRAGRQGARARSSTPSRSSSTTSRPTWWPSRCTTSGDQSGTPFEKPWPLAAWPDVPTRFLLCRDDRFFPAEFQRRVVRERLGITPDEMDGGHLPALSRPQELARRLDAYSKP